MKLSEAALKVLKARYLREGETPEEMFRRVALWVAQSELLYGPASEVHRWEEEFYDLMSSLKFLPNSPTLMNAGTKINQLAACFVLPVEDSLKGIFETLKTAALIQKTGGGTGFSFGKLRRKGAKVESTGGKASGPLSFIKLFDQATQTIKEGGKRRGANMGVLPASHPDLVEFVNAKRDKKSLQNFNLSVFCPDAFFEAAIKGEEWEFVEPKDGKVVGKANAKELLRLISQAAWECGDPGILYADEINRHNPTPALGPIEATNPCGEVPLLPYEACNLGSVNLSKFVKEGKVDWEGIRSTVEKAVRFLDDAIDASSFPHPKIEEAVKGNRKVGLGVMGWAEMLLKLQIPYASEEALKLARRLMSFINETAHRTSARLAQERGPFPNLKLSVFKGKPMRNATLTSIAPTGTISLIAGTTPSIEPLFAISYRKKVLNGEELPIVEPLFLKFASKYLNREQLEEAIELGSVQPLKGVPKEVKELFKTALEIPPKWHLKVQAAFQRHTDNAVSKTVNLPENATVEEVERVFLEGYRLKLKGTTVFRFGSKEGVIEIGLKSGKIECNC